MLKDERFPETYRVVSYYKTGKGREEMCKVVEEYAKEYAEEYAKEKQIEIAKTMIVDEANLSDEVISRITKLPLKEVQKLREEISVHC